MLFYTVTNYEYLIDQILQQTLHFDMLCISAFNIDYVRFF